MVEGACMESMFTGNRNQGLNPPLRHKLDTLLIDFLVNMNLVIYR